MEISITFELGVKYIITYADGSSKTFMVIGGPDPKVFFEKEEDGIASLSTAINGFTSINKVF